LRNRHELLPDSLTARPPHTTALPRTFSLDLELYAHAGRRPADPFESPWFCDSGDRGPRSRSTRTGAEPAVQSSSACWLCRRPANLRSVNATRRPRRFCRLVRYFRAGGDSCERGVDQVPQQHLQELLPAGQVPGLAATLVPEGSEAVEPAEFEKNQLPACQMVVEKGQSSRCGNRR
jgi:hypothetical protein